MALFITALASLILGLFVWLKDIKKTSNITLGLLSLAIAFWAFAQFMGGIFDEKWLVLFWSRLGIAAACFIPVFFLHFILSLIDKTKFETKLIKIVYGLGLIFLLLDLTKLFVADVGPTMGYKFYPKAGVVYPFFAVFLFAVFIYAFVRLVLALKLEQGEKKNQLTYVFIACLIAFLGGATTFFPIWNIDLPILTTYVLPIYLLITVYAIVKHRLLDISIIIREGLIYSVLTLVFAGFYVLAVLFTNSYLQTLGHFGPFITSLLVVIVSAFIFLPLRNRLQAIVDRIFYRGEYRFQKTIDDLSEENKKLFAKLLQADKLAALGTLAAGMAHEIKNPLASMKGLTQVLPENLNDQAFLTRYQEVVERQINRINDIVEKLLNFGQPQQLEIKEINLTRVINDVLSLIEPQLIKNDVEVEKKLHGAIMIEADEANLSQVFMNLFLNAIQAMPDSGKLALCSKLEPGGRVLLEVTDTGEGIGEAALGKIFDPFYTTKAQGSGMGLAVAYRIVNEHHGEIQVESAPKKGTTFKIWLPLKQPLSA